MANIQINIKDIMLFDGLFSDYGCFCSQIIPDCQLYLQFEEQTVLQ